MIPTRAALAVPAIVLVLSGCGAVSAVTVRTTTHRAALADAAPAKTPIATATPAPAPVPPIVSGVGGSIVETVPGTGANEWLEILNSHGAVVARTSIDPPNFWMTSAGPAGAYWTQGGSEHVLTAAGAVLSLGTVPADANDVVIGPDGASYAYATSDQLKDVGTSLNKIVVVRPGAAAQVIADRISDPNHPTADAPYMWDYYLLSWTTPGIAFARVPTGGCGCGSFDMQMQSAFSGIINPASEVVTTLTADNSCPLSQVGPSTETVCFATANGAAGNTSIRIGSNGVVTHTYTLSGTTLGGDATFAPDGSSVAYITIPVSEDTCGATLTPTLRVLDVATGSAVSRNVGDFTPQAWGQNGLIYGQMTDGSDSWLVSVNPATFAVTRLTTNSSGAGFVGIM
jgi:hypothetical protein